MLRRGFTEGSRTRRASSSGNSGKASPSSSPAPQNTWQPGPASAKAARTSEDLPMPGSPSISTAPPRPAVTSVTSLTSISVSASRPISALPRGTMGTERIVPLEKYGHNQY